MNKLVIGLTVIVGLASNNATAASWKRTDRNAKIIANKINQLEDKMEQVASTEGEDNISKRDELREQITMAEVDLVDAIQTILHSAYESGQTSSEKQKRYMKRVSKNVSASQLAALQKILDDLHKNSSWMTEEYAMDFIEKESEKLARNEILALKDKLQKHKDRDVAALMKTTQFN